MKLTDLEKKLLRQQAEAYAFISGLRRTAIMNRDVRYVKMTEGIELRVAKRQKEYPTVFKRYFNEALKKAEAQQLRSVNNIPQAPEINGQRKETPRRKKETSKKKPKKVESRRRTRRNIGTGIAKDKPE